MRRLFALLLMIAMSLPAWAEERPRAGLMWNRSGLPATLPLVVKTMPGRDYVVFIGDDDSDPVMAGYIHGGTFFRLLVPPGTWTVRFAHGQDWHGDDALFGPLTEWTRMKEPMTFGASVARKHGHIIRLIETEGRMRIVSAGPLDLCQGLLLDIEAVNLDDESEDPNRLPTPGLRRLEMDLDVWNRVCG